MTVIPPLRAAWREPLVLSRMLWGAFCWSIAGVLLVLGSGYAIAGTSAAASSKAFEIVVRYVPGGMRTHGILMLLLGLSVLYGLAPTLYGGTMLDRWLQRTLAVVAGYSLWLVLAFAGSWMLTGTSTFGGLVWWLGGTVQAVVLIELRPPPPLVRRRIGRTGRAA